MAEDDEVDILGDFDDQDLVGNTAIVPVCTEMGFADCNDVLSHSVAHDTLFLGDCADKLKANFGPAPQDSDLPSSCLSQKSPLLKNRKRPWSPAERALFEKGMALYGRRWTKISRLVGTRTTLQVKNYATHYFKMLVKSECAVDATKPNDPLLTNNVLKMEESANSIALSANFSEIVTSIQNDVGAENDEVDVVADVFSEAQRTPSSPSNVALANSSPDGKSSDLDCSSEATKSFNFFGSEQSVVPESDGNFGVVNSPHNDTLCKTDSASLKDLPISAILPYNHSFVGLSASVDDGCADVCSGDLNNTSKDDADMSQTDNSASDDTHHELLCDPPTQEVVVDHVVVTDEEKVFHREFFEGRFPKTPERYMKIRNYILDMWEKSKPKYLNKTCIRAGLRNCGDVNSIGRIHAYLEMKGAINFGCEQAQYNRPTSLAGASAKTNKIAVTGNLKEIVGSRKRKSPMESSLPIFEGGQGGFTIEHTIDGDKVVCSPELKPSIKPRANPFRLIPCTMFSHESEAPYSVVLHVEAVVIMDIHAHTSNTEVIGLLGGFYNAASHQLEIVIAKPCHSLSTGRQCEMDPVSQTEASQALEALGLAVVGWYHSHPTFLPHPSLRDLETQAKYQEWFGQHRNPFVAVIVSPYSGPLVSKILCMIVGEATDNDAHRQPFQLSMAFTGASFRPEQCLNGVATLLRDFVAEATAVAMDTAFAAKPEYTLLKKMLASVESHLTKAEVFSSNGFVESLNQLMVGKEVLLASCGENQV